MLQSGKLVTPGMMGHTWKNGSHLPKRVTLENMGHCYRFECFSGRKFVSKQNAGMSETTTRIFISHERGNSTQYFTTSSRQACNYT